MADLSDVEAVLVRETARSLGLGQSYREGSAVLSQKTGVMCRVYRGWPIAAALDQDIAEGTMSVTVFPVGGATRRTTKFVPQWHAAPPVTPRLEATASQDTVTFTGYADLGQVAGIKVSISGVPPSAYAYRIKAGDSPLTVASALAVMIPGAAVASNVVTVSGATLDAHVVADRTEWLETRRQLQHFWVMGWAPTPAARDKVMSVVDAGFAGLTNEAGALTTFIQLPDSSFGDLRYYSVATFDKAQQASAWRRDLRYTVEYSTTLVETHPEVLFVGMDVNEDGTEFQITI
jgi:hypothetical protein